MKLTEKYIRNLMMDTVKKMNNEEREAVEIYVQTLPIIVSARFSRTLGQFRYMVRPRFSPVDFRFSKHIENLPTEVMNDIIKHELMHLLADTLNDAPCKHNAQWKNLCKKYGVVPTATRPLSDESRDSMYKYTLSCPECGSKWHRSRLSASDKQYFRNKCKCTCGHKGLKITQNF